MDLLRKVVLRGVGDAWGGRSFDQGQAGRRWQSLGVGALELRVGCSVREEPLYGVLEGPRTGAQARLGLGKAGSRGVCTFSPRWGWVGLVGVCSLGPSSLPLSLPPPLAAPDPLHPHPEQGGQDAPGQVVHAV